jgi:hypothetical protein
MKRRQSLFTIGLLLGVGFPGLMGILAVQAKALSIQMVNPQFAIQNELPSFISTLTITPFPTSTSTSLPLPSLTLSPGGSSDNVYAFIQAPSGLVERPYVLLTAFAFISRTDSVEIRGFVNSDEFICTNFPCSIFLETSSRFVFRAYSNSGTSSDEVIASVNVIQSQGGYLVNIDSVSQYTKFTDSCSVLWGIGDEENAKWDDFVQFPYQLNTRKTLHTLATKLILNGVVDTRDCPFGGLSTGLDWPTTCGLEKASTTITQWQNQYDEYIWLASRDEGIPPKILKTLFEVESQFWPGNSRFYLDEYGLGQINQLGVDVLLRRDPDLYQQVCASVFSDCFTPYLSLTSDQQRLIRGAVINSVDASCPTCPYGINLDKAKQSVDLLSRLMKANCQQVDAILGSEISDANYEDLWRFTLATYHSGMSCFQDAFLATKNKNLPITWENLENELNCMGGKDYVNGYMDNLFSFDYYLYKPGDALSVVALSTIVPTRTPIPTPTVFVSNARIVVQVYLDRNRNGLLDADEGIDAMTVQVSTSDNKQISQRTQNGIAIFDMSGYTPNVGVTVSLPGLYRNEMFVLPQYGDVSISFKFDMPVLPTNLP